LIFERGGGQIFGALIVYRKVPPQCHRHSIYRLTRYGSLQALLFVHI
jgi:hypothetical protein